MNTQPVWRRAFLIRLCGTSRYLFELNGQAYNVTCISAGAKLTSFSTKPSDSIRLECDVGGFDVIDPAWPTKLHMQYAYNTITQHSPYS